GCGRIPTRSGGPGFPAIESLQRRDEERNANSRRNWRRCHIIYDPRRDDDCPAQDSDALGQFVFPKIPLEFIAWEKPEANDQNSWSLYRVRHGSTNAI